MVENRPWLDFLAHAVLIVGVVLVAFPLYVTFVASTLTYDQIITVPMPLLPGDQLIENYSKVLTSGSDKGSSAPVSTMLVNSFVMATPGWRKGRGVSPLPDAALIGLVCHSYGGCDSG